MNEHVLKHRLKAMEMYREYIPEPNNKSCFKYGYDSSTEYWANEIILAANSDTPEFALKALIKRAYDCAVVNEDEKYCGHSGAKLD